MESVIDKFLRYISVETTSDPDSETQPSTPSQVEFMKILVKELEQMGVKDVSLDEFGYVMASIPSNLNNGETAPKLGFIAHVDTSPDAPGKDIKPQFFHNYDGGEIVINKEKNLVLSPIEFPELKKYIGQTIITSDGNTLLGADDKAGVAEIMSAVEYIFTHPDFKHGEIKIAFTPDEEIGRGVDKFDVTRFGAEFAYTLDGGEIGEMEYENFNAASAKIFIQGRNIHPGYAKNKMINSILLATEFNSLLPVEQRPELTEGYEGFIHIVHMSGTVEESMIQYIIRDHDRAKFEEKKKLVEDCTDFMNCKYKDNRFRLELKDQYYNMKEKVEPHYHIIEKAVEAMKKAGITAQVQPIRGGTDGARLSYMGLPCPNIFAGGHNFHGKLEYVPAESMEKAVEVIINLISLYIQHE
ncbi:MAG TPA: peptidase T [Bacteroidales bacterium]|nr:peptidase T [Bacteroidales bacterium]HRT83598.1 peptidase T [Bacteroidales bacterium]